MKFMLSVFTEIQKILPKIENRKQRKYNVTFTKNMFEILFKILSVFILNIKLNWISEWLNEWMDERNTQ